MPPELSVELSRSPDIETVVHASCVRWGEHGLLIRGASGAGKSDLALRLINRGALLVADDVVRLKRDEQRVFAEPVAMAGAIEVHGHGIFDLPSMAETAITHAVHLDAKSAGDRLETPEYIDLMGIEIPLVRLDPNHVSALARLRVLLAGRRLV